MTRGRRAGSDPAVIPTPVSILERMDMEDVLSKRESRQQGPSGVDHDSGMTHIGILYL